MFLWQLNCLNSIKCSFSVFEKLNTYKVQTIPQQVIKYVIQISSDNLHTAVLMYIFLIEARS